MKNLLENVASKFQTSAGRKAGRTVEYSPLNLPIMASLLSERYCHKLAFFSTQYTFSKYVDVGTN